DRGRGDVDEDEALHVLGDDGAAVVAQGDVHGAAGKGDLPSGGLEDLVGRHDDAAVRLHPDLEPTRFIGRPGQGGGQEATTQGDQQRRKNEPTSEAHGTPSSNGSSAVDAGGGRCRRALPSASAFAVGTAYPFAPLLAPASRPSGILLVRRESAAVQASSVRAPVPSTNGT